MDNTLEILKKYDGTYNMRWISEPDEGQADAISKGFQLCQGDFLCWLNADDLYVCRTAISRVVSLFHEYPQVDVITGGGVSLTENGHWIQLIEVPQKRACYKHLRYGDSILQPATFFRRNVLDLVQLDSSLHYAFDWDFFMQLSKHYNFLAVNEIWAGYRKWGGNKTAVGGASRARELLEVTGRYLSKVSWQYYVVFLFYILYRFLESLPGSIALPLSRILKKSSLIVSIITFRRVTTV